MYEPSISQHSAVVGIDLDFWAQRGNTSRVLRCA